MVQRQNRNKSMSLYLSAIAVVDTIVLVIGKMLDNVNALMLSFGDMHDSQVVHSDKAEVERSEHYLLLNKAFVLLEFYMEMV